MTLHTDWEGLRNDLEAELRLCSIQSNDTLHLVANDLTVAIRGERLPFHNKHVDEALMPYLNALAKGAVLAIRAARTG